MATDAAAGSPTGVDSPGRARVGVRTLRSDNWRKSPVVTAAILSFFVLYSVIRIFMNKYYFVADYHYLTPVYSPCVAENCNDVGAADFGTFLPRLPFGVPMAILVFPILAGFRTTCYYYRKAGYRSLWLSPNACGVPEPHAKYTGERRFPLIIMNYHRYFFVLAGLLLLVNTYDAVRAFEGADGGFGIGLGTLIMVVNVVMLWLYSLSCHACRHIVGGRLKHFSKHPVRYRMWTFVSRLNPRHGNFAMASLATVITTDAYIMCVSAGWLTDLRFWN